MQSSIGEIWSSVCVAGSLSVKVRLSADAKSIDLFVTATAALNLFNPPVIPPNAPFLESVNWPSGPQ